MWLVCSCNLKIPVPSPICRNNSIYSVSPWSVSYPICLSVVFYHSMLFLPRLSPAGLCHGLAAVFLLGKTSESKDLVWLARQVHSLCGVSFLVVGGVSHRTSCFLLPHKLAYTPNCLNLRPLHSKGYKIKCVCGNVFGIQNCMCKQILTKLERRKY